MPVRYCLAALAVAVCLCSPSAHAQQDTGGKLTLPADVFGTGDYGAESSTPAMTSGVSGAELPPAAPFSGSPSSYSGGGSSFSSSLGGHLRARYNTQSYGQSAGNLDLGTMFLQQDGDRAWFADGQLTLNDESQVGFNLGLGVRGIVETSPLLGDEEKILGLSVWADGSSTVNDNFFPQIGLSGELLGEKWDFRGNASFVLEDQTAFGETVAVSGAGQYNGNFLATSTLTGTDNALHLTELEAARRIGNRDLWGFAGGYGLYGADGVDAAGYKLGARGYATPDLLLQLAVTDDDLFGTNTAFSLTWFIGRTRTNTCLTGRLVDRLREPVMRNDYVAVYNDQASGFVDALTADLDGDGDSEEVRIVHVNSAAVSGGDGTFENPLNSLDDIEANSQEFDVVLVHSGSAFADQTATLQNSQRLLGEGDDMTFNIATDQFGQIALPESSSGAQAGAAPVITNTAASAAAVALADANEVANLDINGGVSAVVAGASGAGDPNLHDLDITNTTGDAIVLSPLERVDGADTTIAFNATLDTITFDGVGGNDITIDAATTADPNDANVTLNETISLSNITSTNNGATSLSVTNTHDGGSLTVDNYDWTGSSSIGSVVGMSFDSTAGTVTVSNSTLTGGSGGTATGFSVTGTTGAVAIGTSNAVTDINGVAATIFQNEETVDFAATVNNSSVDGGTVQVFENTGAVTVNGDITTQAVTSLEIRDVAANVTVNGNITRNGTAGTAVSITDTNAGDDDPNDGIQIAFNTATALIDSNDGSSAFLISGGDDDITVLSAIEDTGGITVQNRTGGEVDFGAQITSETGANDAVVIGPTGNTNSDDSIVSFLGLDITTTTGRGLVANSGEVNVTGTGNTITTGDAAGALVLQGTVANPVTSTSGLTFASIETGSGATDAVVLENVEGSVTVNGGTLNSVGNAAVSITNATGFSLSDAEINSTGVTDAVSASYSNDTSNSLSLNSVELNNGDVTVAAATTDAGAATTVTMTSVTETGAVALANSGDGDLSATLATVTGTTNDNITLDVTGDGAGSLTMNTVNTGGAVTATSGVGANGNLTLSMTNSGNTTDFGAITINDQGDGNVTASLSNVTTNSTLDFDAAGGGSASLSVTGGSVTGAFTADAANNGSFTATVGGSGSYGSTVDVTATNTGSANVNLSGSSTIAGATTVTTNNSGASTVNLSGNNYDDVVTVNANNTEDLTFTMTAADIDAGSVATGFDLNIGANVDDAGLSFVANNYDSGVNIDAANSGALDLSINDDTVITGTDDVAFTLAVANSVDGGDILIENSTYNTNAAGAFVFTNDAGGAVDFQLDDNTFTSTSVVAAAASITTTSSTLNATIGGADQGFSGNLFTNGANGTNQFEMTADGAGVTANLLLADNTANSANGNFNLVVANGATFDIFESADVNAQSKNSGTVNFDPNFAAFGDLANEPQRP